MTIAIIADVLGEENNGTSITVKRLICNLKKRGHEVLVVSPDKPLMAIHYQWEDPTIESVLVTYTSNLLSGGAKPTDVQELLGHSDVNTTMSIYAHATREAKRTSARLLDKVVGGA